MDPSRRVRKKSGYHHGDLRRALINAALRLVEEQGAAAVTLREVARMAGVSHQAPYRHFADRTALLGAVAEEGFLALYAEVVEKTRKVPDALSRLHAIGATYVLFAVAHRAHFRVMFSAEAAVSRSKTPSLDAAGAAVFGALTEAIGGAKRMTSDETDTLALALTCWSTVHGLATLLVEGQLERRVPGSAKELTELVTSILRRGLVPSRKPSKDTAAAGSREKRRQEKGRK
jgi:AcrR family transcriptional regulator